MFVSVSSLSGSYWTRWEHRRAGTYRTKGTFIGIRLICFESLTCAVAYFSLFLYIITGRARSRGRTWSSWSRWTQGELFSKSVLILLDSRCGKLKNTALHCNYNYSLLILYVFSLFLLSLLCSGRKRRHGSGRQPRR